MNERMQSYRGQEVKPEGYVYAPYIPIIQIKPKTGTDLDDSYDYTINWDKTRLKSSPPYETFHMRDRIEYDLIMTDAQRFRKEYYDSHKSCPRCGSQHTVQTLLGYTLDCSNLQAYRDENRARCGDCGWTGTVHELVK